MDDVERVLIAKNLQACKIKYRQDPPIPNR